MSKVIKITLKAARVNAGLTVTQAAKLIGISPTTLIKWEKDSGIVTPNKQLVIQKVYKFPIDYIFFGNELELKSS
ncbi:helix-turn-helix transcriptional regulator [Lysinibacillus boronitolerans]|nr:helix-turn-helix transcriptional regulator [Lysinibacillus boronitolerans]